MIDLGKITLTQHALFQLKQRGITKKDVVDCVRYPDKVLKQSKIRSRALQVTLQKQKRYLLVVIYDQTSNEISIITAFITSKIKKYL